MFDNTHVYDLSFVSPTRRAKTKPQIVFTLKPGYLDELIAVLHKAVRHNENRVAWYCGSRVSFTQPSPDLFDNTEFGYEKCGFVTTDNSNVHLHIELAGDSQLDHVVLTLHILTKVLLILGHDGKQHSNLLQQLDLATSCDTGGSAYSHAINGYASPRLTSWLLAQGAKQPKGQDSIPVPKAVTTAMRRAWRAIVPDELKKYSRECYGYINRDGRFMLSCFGNSCEVAIYPDLLHGKIDEYPVQFGCHNLDNAHQQVTLIAGLAKLCELARNEEET